MVEAIPLLPLLLFFGAVSFFLGKSAGKRSRALAWLVGAFIFLLLTSLLGWTIWKFTKSRQLQAFDAPITHIETTGKVIALTFDDGPTPAYTEEILEILARYQVHATFFVTGQELQQSPDLGQRIVAAGHQLGNHSYSHRQMFLKPLSWIKQEVEQTDALIRQAGQTAPIPFRPPYTKKLFLLPYYLHQTQRVTVLCSLEPESYREIAADSAKIVDYVLQNVRPGSILLLHLMYDGREPSRQALPGIIEGLQEQGYRFVTVEELLETAPEKSPQ